MGDRPPALRGFMVPHVQRLLNEAPLLVIPPEVAPRSPLGDHALRVRPAQEENSALACQQLAAWLEPRPWVEQLALRPPHVYVRLSTNVAEAWVQAGMTERQQWLHAASTASLNGAPAACCANPKQPLQQLRQDAVQETWQRLCEVLGVTEGPPPLAEGVDIPQGTLRARSGGSVGVQDVLTALQASMTHWGTRAPSAEAALRFLLLRAPRGQRVPLTDARLADSQRALARLRGVCDMSTIPVVAPAGTALRRSELAALLDQFDAVLLRAWDQQDACPLLRHVQQIVEALDAAHGLMAASGGLRQAARQGIAACLDLCGLTELHARPPVAPDTTALPEGTFPWSVTP
jgi:hypothetical protein